jgi:four helix bundle protein
MTETTLKNRFKQFAIDIILFGKTIPKTQEYYGIKGQIFRSGTSPAANYRAACRAKSGPDWVNKLKIVEEELDETQLWLEVIVAVYPTVRNEAARLWKEADELLSITVKSIKTSRKNTKSQRWPINRK